MIFLMNLHYLKWESESNGNLKTEEKYDCLPVNVYTTTKFNKKLEK